MVSLVLGQSQEPPWWWQSLPPARVGRRSTCWQSTAGILVTTAPQLHSVIKASSFLQLRAELSERGSLQTTTESKWPSTEARGGESQDRLGALMPQGRGLGLLGICEKGLSWCALPAICTSYIH